MTQRSLGLTQVLSVDGFGDVRTSFVSRIFGKTDERCKAVLLVHRGSLNGIVMICYRIAVYTKCIAQTAHVLTLPVYNPLP